MGNRKARKSVFRAVEQGNFGDDWDLPAGESNSQAT